MEELTRDEILTGLRNLGVAVGNQLIVHSSLAALGKVQGGAETVIDALLAAVGESGLVCMPTFVCQPPFDRRRSPTALGAIPDLFWRRPNALRSLHPTHSVAAIGRGAAELITGHETAPTAYGPGTPYHRLAMSGGKVLLLGVDQDRNTTLHAAEAILDAPYLGEVAASYIDDSGNLVTITVKAMAGPHRNFIGLDPLFRQRGLMRLGRIGQAVCRFMDGGEMLETTVAALRRDPAAVLCDNPECTDCVEQRGRIKAARLKSECFRLAAVAGEISNRLEPILGAIRAEGISTLELTAQECNQYLPKLLEEGVSVAAVRGLATDEAAKSAAVRLRVPLVVPVDNDDDFRNAAELRQQGLQVLVENVAGTAKWYEQKYQSFKPTPGLAFNPRRFAAEGEKPFLEVFYHGPLRRFVRHFYIEDGTAGGIPTLPGRGNGEVKEIISMLRCRSFSGTLTIRASASGAACFREAASAFWQLLDNM